MTEKKDQKVVVFLSMNSSDKMLILNGIKLASIFKKELCLFYLFSKKEKKYNAEIKELIDNYVIPIKKEIPELRVSTLFFAEKFSILPERLSNDFEAILLIAGASQFRKYSGTVSESPVPFLFINEKTDFLPDYKKLILPVDLRKETSESVLWCSYFGRFNKAEIVVVAANDKGKNEQKQLTQNLFLTKKLFQKFGIVHKIYKGNKSSLGVAFEALKLAVSSNADLFVVLGSSVITPLDWLVGLPERKIIKQAGNIPVMIVNPRRDNYVLCD